MATTIPLLNYQALAERLDLPEAETLEEQIQHLQQRRRDQLESLLARDPAMVPTASMLRVRASRWDEIGICEAALTTVSAPFEREEGEEPS